jgi:hypothetical protein
MPRQDSAADPDPSRRWATAPSAPPGSPATRGTPPHSRRAAPLLPCWTSLDSALSTATGACSALAKQLCHRIRRYCFPCGGHQSERRTAASANLQKKTEVSAPNTSRLYGRSPIRAKHAATKPRLMLGCMLDEHNHPFRCAGINRSDRRAHAFRDAGNSIKANL